MGKEWGIVGKKGREWGIVGKKGARSCILYTHTDTISSLPLGSVCPGRGLTSRTEGGGVVRAPRPLGLRERVVDLADGENPTEAAK